VNHETRWEFEMTTELVSGDRYRAPLYSANIV